MNTYANRLTILLGLFCLLSATTLAAPKFITDKKKLLERNNIKYYINETQPYSGSLVLESYDNGQYKQIHQYTDGEKSGVDSYHPNGQISLSGRFTNSPKGEIRAYKYYREDGTTKLSSYWLYDSATKISHPYSDWTWFDKKNNPIEMRTYGKLNGKIIIFSSENKKRFVREYKNGAMNGTQEVWLNGVLISKEAYKNNKKNGFKESFYHKTGAKSARVSYENNELVGKREIYHPHCDWITEGYFKNGKPDGIWYRHLASNGIPELVSIGTYQEGKKQGQWISYTNGEPYYLKIFIDDEVISEEVLSNGATKKYDYFNECPNYFSQNSANTNNKVDTEEDRKKTISRIQSKISANWTRPSGLPKNLSCNIRIRLLDDGSVLSVSTTKSSGYISFDTSAELAVKNASPLPMPSNTLLKRSFNLLNLQFKPD